MSERKLLKDILEIIEGLNHGETIEIEEIIKIINIEEEKVMKEIIYAFKFYIIHIEGKNSYDHSAKLDKKNRITSLDKDGIVLLDLLRNPQLFQEITQKYPELNNCSIYTLFYFFRRMFL